MSQILLP